jgi:hypothetical protein
MDPGPLLAEPTLAPLAVLAGRGATAALAPRHDGYDLAATVPSLDDLEV